MTSPEQDAQFLRWIRDHLGLMIKVARAYAKDASDQEDLMQEILVQLWSSIPQFRGDSEETTWIYRVAIQTAMVWQRGERRRHHRQARLLQETTRGTPTEGDRSTANAELIEQLYEAIREMPKLDASIAIMHLDGLTYREMAEVIGISESYIGVKLNRIRKRLSDRFREDPS